MIVALDGPAAAGKRTLGRRLADHLGLRYLDSGELYRAVAARVLRTGGDPSDAQQAGAAAGALAAADLSAPELRDEAVSDAASVVAAIPEVRAALLDYQRAFGRAPPGAVIEGRDIGTVVFPNATHKLFVTASPEARVERRYKELRDRGVDCDREEVRRKMAERDRRDSERAVAPLAAAKDALVLDSTDLDPEAAFRAALGHIGDKGSGVAPVGPCGEPARAGKGEPP